eukprot:934959-Pleurochrysis_carterae.AAC.2
MLGTGPRPCSSSDAFIFYINAQRRGAEAGSRHFGSKLYRLTNFLYIVESTVQIKRRVVDCGVCNNADISSRQQSLCP